MSNPIVTEETDGTVRVFGGRKRANLPENCVEFEYEEGEYGSSCFEMWLYTLLSSIVPGAYVTPLLVKGAELLYVSNLCLVEKENVYGPTEDGAFGRSAWYGGCYTGDNGREAALLDSPVIYMSVPYRPAPAEEFRSRLLEYFNRTYSGTPLPAMGLSFTSAAKDLGVERVKDRSFITDEVYISDGRNPVQYTVTGSLRRGSWTPSHCLRTAEHVTRKRAKKNAEKNDARRALRNMNCFVPLDVRRRNRKQIAEVADLLREPSVTEGLRCEEELKSFIDRRMSLRNFDMSRLSVKSVGSLSADEDGIALNRSPYEKLPDKRPERDEVSTDWFTDIVDDIDELLTNLHSVHERAGKKCSFSIPDELGDLLKDIRNWYGFKMSDLGKHHAAIYRRILSSGNVEEYVSRKNGKKEKAV